MVCPPHLDQQRNRSDLGYLFSRSDEKIDVVCSNPRIPDHLCDKRAFLVVYAVRREHISLDGECHARILAVDNR